MTQPTGKPTGKTDVAPSQTGNKKGSTRNRTIRGIGSITARGPRFAISYQGGRLVTFTWRQKGIVFRAAKLKAIAFKGSVARLTGTALVNGKRMRFAAVAIDRGTRHDFLRLAWGGGASHGGTIRRGSLSIP